MQHKLESVPPERRMGDSNAANKFSAAQEAEIQEAERRERFFETLDEFEEYLESEGAQKNWKAWLEQYGHDPTSYVSPENLERLTLLSPGERLGGLAHASAFLELRPRDAERYFQRFPEDLEAVAELFENLGGVPETGREHTLFTLCIPLIEKTLRPLAVRDQYRLEQYREIAERRNLAPDFLLQGNHALREEDFGEALNGLCKTMEEAEELEFRGDHFLNPHQIFTKEFEALSEHQKARVLRSAIADVQYALVFHETFNSPFTAKRVRNAEKLMKEDEERMQRRNPSFRRNPRNDIAHSILFRTYHPISLYELEDEYLKHEMLSIAELAGEYIEAYPYHRILIALIEKLGELNVEQDENTDLLVELWNKNRDPIFGKAIADALSRQNPSRAAGRLLELIRTEKGNKQALAAILYRLELGQVGISENGVQYLQRRYDLGEYNNPNFFVRRLSSSGEMGVFDMNRELLGYFPLDDLTDEQKVIRAKVLDLTYEMLFTPRENETTTERQRREQILDEFRKKYFRFYDDEFFQKTRVHFNNLTLREQGWFLHFANRADRSRKERATEFAARYGENGLRTFLSLDYGDELGDIILELGERLPGHIAAVIFTKYGEIIDATRDVRSELERYTSVSDHDSGILLDRIAEHLLRRGKDLLVGLHREIIETSSEEYEQRVGRIIQRLGALHADILLFGATFKELSRHERIPLEEIRGTEIAMKNARELTTEERREMMAFFEENRRGVYPEDLFERVARDFRENKLQSGRFYLLRHEGKLAGFVRYEDLPNGKVRATSLNAPPFSHGFGLGPALFAATLTREGAKRPVVGEVYAENPAFALYEQMGFQRVREYAYPGTQHRFIEIELPPVTQTQTDEKKREAA
jgi:ribosomal protein S18 acetylase RimI-like enzyme